MVDESFADLTKVQGLRGIYIASQITLPTGLSRVGPEHISTLITFDRGVEWRPLEAPKFDNDGQPLNCSVVSYVIIGQKILIFLFCSSVLRKSDLYFSCLLIFRLLTVHCTCHKGSLSCTL